MQFATTLYYWKGAMLYKLMRFLSWVVRVLMFTLSVVSAWVLAPIGVTGATWAVKDSTSVQKRYCT